MLESTRSIVDPKMSDEEYHTEVKKISTTNGLDIERSNLMLIVKSRLDKEMHKKIENAK